MIDKKAFLCLCVNIHMYICLCIYTHVYMFVCVYKHTHGKQMWQTVTKGKGYVVH